MFRVHYRHGKAWVFWAITDTEPEALEAARNAWRRGVAGVRVTQCVERVILEKMRDD